MSVSSSASPVANIAPNPGLSRCPRSIAELDLAPGVLLSLLLKHLLKQDVMTLKQCADALGVIGNIIEELIQQAKQTGLVENRASSADGQLRFALSGIGRQRAQQYMEQSGYLGLAPVSLNDYRRVCMLQSSRKQPISRRLLSEQFAKTVMNAGLLEQLGPAINSSRPVLIYGAAGTGKSYICRQLNQVFHDDVKIPHAIAVGRDIIQVFDPQLHELHEPADESSKPLLGLHDARWHRCRRPLLIVGGELEEAKLDIAFDNRNKVFKAPIGLLANNGVLLIDDLGRQKISAKAIFNRWIVPLEEARDFLSLPSGDHFEVPFEQILLFSTNLNPSDLFDPAFLRRLGYKIEFKAISPEHFIQIWQQECDRFELDDGHELSAWLANECYPMNGIEMLPCHPRDLLSIVADLIHFNELPKQLTPALIDRAWNSYFVRSNTCPLPHFAELSTDKESSQ